MSTSTASEPTQITAGDLIYRYQGLRLEHISLHDPFPKRAANGHSTLLPLLLAVQLTRCLQHKLSAGMYSITGSGAGKTRVAVKTSSGISITEAIGSSG